MPNNGMDVLKTALMIAVPVGTMLLNAWINITIKFAPDAREAKIEIIRILARVAMWISNCVLLAQLVWEFVSPHPNLRFSVLVIALDCSALSANYMMWIVIKLADFVTANARDLDRLHETVRALVAIVDKKLLTPATDLDSN
jgi:hypothetical protein